MFFIGKNVEEYQIVLCRTVQKLLIPKGIKTFHSKFIIDNTSVHLLDYLFWYSSKGAYNYNTNAMNKLSHICFFQVLTMPKMTVSIQPTSTSTAVMALTVRGPMPMVLVARPIS